MNFIEFRDKFQDYSVINSFDLSKIGNKKTISNQVVNWTKKGLLIQLKRGLYVLSPKYTKTELTNAFIANQIYSPSYVSLEYALDLYEIIPEIVPTLTSITTKKTMSIQNDFGFFTYQHIKPLAFRGFIKETSSNGLSYFIAEPEKAVVDFIYLNLSNFKTDDYDIFEESYRFQNLKSLSAGKIMFYAKLFRNEKLAAVSKNLCELIKRYKK